MKEKINYFSKLRLIRQKEIGRLYNFLTIQDIIEGRRPKAICLCSCGNTKIIILRNIINNHTQSCGCFIKKSTKHRSKNQMRELNSSWIKDRNKLHTNYKLTKAMRAMVKRTLFDKKIFRTRTYLGYTKNDLYKHLESKFTNQMSWDNYGTYWHIDHIIPVSYFLKHGIFEPAVINALSNLQPLEAIKNLSKGAKINVARTPNN